VNFDRITVDPARMNGQPGVRDVRVTVRRVVELAAFFPDRKELLQEYPVEEGFFLTQLSGKFIQTAGDLKGIWENNRGAHHSPVVVKTY
jgi:hypothetical protein